MNFSMTDEEWNDYEQRRKKEYGTKNDRTDDMDVFDWLMKDETSDEKTKRLNSVKSELAEIGVLVK